MKILDEPKAIRIKIMDFLSRREHSSKEIFQKLSPRVESKELLEEERLAAGKQRRRQPSHGKLRL